jgi:superfamily II DNA or RNA helicase
MKRVLIDDTTLALKKKLTVQPYLPGSPVVVSYCMYKIHENYIYIPKYFNCTHENTRELENEHVSVKININCAPRDYQKNVITDIHNEIIKNDSCMACLYTGWGKTFASLYIAHLLCVKTLIIVNKEALLEQWKEQIIKFTGIVPGIIQGTKIDTQADICIGMIQSISMKEYTDIFKEFGFTIYDETHHYCSKVFSNVFFKIRTKYNLGLTATIKRADKLEYVLEWFLGKIAVDVKLLIIEPEIQIYYFCDYDENTIKFNVNGKINSPGSLTAITENKLRTGFILKIVKDMYKEGRKILVLTDRKAQCEYIKEMLKELSVGIYYGGMKMEELKKSNDCRIIVATYQMASEGYDNPELDTLILASPKCNVEQAVGRILRKKNKNNAVVVDINDCISIFNNWNKKRQSFYKSRNFKIKYVNDNCTKDTNDNYTKDTNDNYTKDTNDIKLNKCLIID